jgi:hypothetical protein
MKCLDKEAKDTLDKLVLMAADGYAKVNNSDFMAVVIEMVAHNSFSVAHYGELNGDLMADPEMLFWQNDDNWYPYYYLNHYAGVEQVSVEFNKNKPVSVNHKLQKSMAEFANEWMRNIKEQQGL